MGQFGHGINNTKTTTVSKSRGLSPDLISQQSQFLEVMSSENNTMRGGPSTNENNYMGGGSLTVSGVASKSHID